MDSGKQPLRQKHQDDENQKDFGVKPVQWPVEKHSEPNKNGREDKKNFFRVEIKWTEVHTFRIEKKL